MTLGTKQAGQKRLDEFLHRFAEAARDFTPIELACIAEATRIKTMISAASRRYTRTVTLPQETQTAK